MKRIVIITGFEAFNRGLYQQAAQWAQRGCPGLEVLTFNDRDLQGQAEQVEQALAGADVFFASLIFDYDQVQWLRARVLAIPIRLVFESALELMALLKQKGINKLGLLGGGQLIASLFADDLLDFLWLTLCPYWVGGRLAPTPLGGTGLPLHQAQALELLSATTVNQEVFLHYRFWPRNPRA